MSANGSMSNNCSKSGKRGRNLSTKTFERLCCCLELLPKQFRCGFVIHSFAAPVHVLAQRRYLDQSYLFVSHNIPVSCLGIIFLIRNDRLAQSELFRLSIIPVFQHITANL